jgi:DNA repair protein RecO (recombination protein O)
LPEVLAGKGDASNAEIVKALGTTGYFMEHRLIKSLGDRPMPAARARLLDAIARSDAD